MSKKQILLAAGTLVLGVAGFLATSANSKKFANVSTAWFKDGSNTFVTLFHGMISPVSHLTTFARSGHTAFFKTGTSTQKTLYNTNSTSTPLYYK